jgi:hypothetical protein
VLWAYCRKVLGIVIVFVEVIVADGYTMLMGFAIDVQVPECTTLGVIQESQEMPLAERYERTSKTKVTIRDRANLGVQMRCGDKVRERLRNSYLVSSRFVENVRPLP